MKPGELQADLLVMKVVAVEYTPNEGFAVTLGGADWDSGEESAVRLHISAEQLGLISQFANDICHVAPNFDTVFGDAE